MSRKSRIAETLDRVSTNRLELEHVLALADEAGKPVWIQLAKPGEFRGHHAGPFALNAQVFTEIIANFRDSQNKLVPIDFEHASESDPTEGTIPVLGAPAQGWIKDLEVRTDGNLWGLVEWQPTAREYIKTGQYRYISPAIRFGSRDRVSGKPIGARLTSAGLTNQPFLDGMAPLAAKDTQPESPLAVIADALELADEASAASCLSALDAATDKQVARLRTDLRLTLTSTASDVIDTARAWLTEHHQVPASNTEVAPARASDGEKDETMEHAKLLSDAQGQVSELTLKLRAADGEVVQLKAENTALKTRIAEIESKEIEEAVDRAILTYKDTKGATPEMRPHLLSWAKNDRKAFDAMYPVVAADKAHLLRDLSGKREDTTDTNVIRLSDITDELPSIEELCQEIQEKAPTMSWEQVNLKAYEKLTKKTKKAIGERTDAARKAAAGRK
jgi:phage I-like protein